MTRRGECLACSELGDCGVTSAEKVLSSFTCALYKEAPEPVYRARWELMQTYGELNAVKAMLELQPKKREEEDG